MTEERFQKCCCPIANKQFSMRAIKIDVVKKEIYEIDIKGGYQSMCQVLDSEGYDPIRISKTEKLWVDGEGLLRRPPLGAFMYDPYPNALSGHGLILGLRGPDSVGTKLTLEEVRVRVRFVGVEELPLPVILMASFEKIEDLDNFLKERGHDRE
jgi:hypothetical protein